MAIMKYQYEGAGAGQVTQNPVFERQMRRMERIKDVYNAYIVFVSTICTLAVCYMFSAVCIVLGLFAGEIFNSSPFPFMIFFTISSAYYWYAAVRTILDWCYAKIDQKSYY